MEFLIQTYKGEVEHDFSFTLIQQIKAHNEFHSKDPITYTCSGKTDIGGKNPKAIIPVGSVQFMLEYFNRWFGFIPKPVNIPPALRMYEFTKRGTQIINLPQNLNENNSNAILFIKSNTKLKGFTGQVVDLTTLPADEYLVSEFIDLQSEWRGFVHRGELLDLRNYSGNPFNFPNVDIIRNMIEQYTNAPIAYTIDVAVTNNEQTVIIECHEFFSCGLYGFDHHKLPWMLSQAYHEIIKNNLKKS